MAIKLKELSRKPELLSGGHRACAGCACATTIRQVLHATDTPVVVGCATGCMEVVTTIYPYTAWRVPFIHNAFENSAATISGAEAAYRSLRRQGKIDREIKFIAFGGDGGTYDIGLQSLSGAMERGHNMLYVCYNNEAYMNTGIQRSSATPRGAATTTSPAGKAVPGKTQFEKDLTSILVAHRIPYVAQATPADYRDLMTKVQKGLAVDGPAFLNVLASCHRGWRIKMEDSIEICRIAVETCFWPICEVENGEWRLSGESLRIAQGKKPKRPLSDWTEGQGRFRHLSRPPFRHILEENQKELDRRWADLLKKCGLAPPEAA